jgi:hypothetical protein
MPDDIPEFGERRYEPRLATEAGLGFSMGQIAKLPTRRGLIHADVLVALGLCILAAVRVQMWTRWVWACGLLETVEARP